jgi:hypothetical protein
VKLSCEALLLLDNSKIKKLALKVFKSAFGVKYKNKNNIHKGIQPHTATEN